MKAERAREEWLTELNEVNPRLMITSDRCFHIGSGGGCGLRCAAFCDGECSEPYEFDVKDIREEFTTEEFAEICGYYPRFLNA